MQRPLMMTLSVIIASSLVGLITGFTIPLISLDMANKGMTPFFIGFLAALPAAGMLVASFIAPWLSSKIGLTKILSGALAILIIATLASCLLQNLYLLSPFRLMTGIASGVLVVLGESWIAGGASLRYRAALTGLYTSTFTGFQLAGPLLINIEKYSLVYFLLFITVFSLISVLFANKSNVKLTPENRDQISWKSLVSFLPVLSSGVFCFSFFDATVLSIFPLYSMTQGLTEALSVLLISVILIGDAAFQVPIGYVADKFGVRRVHLFLGIMFCVSVLCLPYLFTSTLLLIAGCVVLGAVAGGLYTLSLVRAGTLLSGQRLIVINAMLNLIWAAGSISGPVISGTVISHVGYQGFTGVIFMTGILFLFFQLLPFDVKKSQCSENVSQR